MPTPVSQAVPTGPCSPGPRPRALRAEGGGAGVTGGHPASVFSSWRTPGVVRFSFHQVLLAPRPQPLEHTGRQDSGLYLCRWSARRDLISLVRAAILFRGVLCSDRFQERCGVKTTHTHRDTHTDTHRHTDTHTRTHTHSRQVSGRPCLWIIKTDRDSVVDQP